MYIHVHTWLRTYICTSVHGTYWFYDFLKHSDDAQIMSCDKKGNLWLILIFRCVASLPFSSLSHSHWRLIIWLTHCYAALRISCFRDPNLCYASIGQSVLGTLGKPFGDQYSILWMRICIPNWREKVKERSLNSLPKYNCLGKSIRKRTGKFA